MQQINNFLLEYLNPADALYYLDLYGLIFVIEAFVLLWLAKFVNNLTVPYNLNQQLLEKDNKALSVSFVGYILSVTLLIVGVIKAGERTSLLNDVLSVLLWSVIGIVLLNVARWINDVFILSTFKNVKEIIEDENIGTGAVQFGSYLGSAFVIYSIITHETSETLLVDIIGTIVYFFFCQFFFILFGYLYKRVISYDLHKEIERDNVAAGISFGMTLLAIGIVLSHPLTATYSLLAFSVWFVNGAVLLILARILLDKLLLPGSKLDEEISRDQNWGVALLEGSIAIGVALILNASFFI